MAKRREVDPVDKKPVTRSRLQKAMGIFRYILPYRLYFVLGMIFLFFSTVSFMLLPYLIGRLIDTAGVSAEGEAATGMMSRNNQLDMLMDQLGMVETWDVAILLGVLLFAQALFSFFRVYLNAQVTERAMADIRFDLYHKIVSLPLLFFEQRRVGELTSRLSSDVTQLQGVLSVTIAEFLRQILTLLIGIPILFIIVSAKLALFMLAIFPVLVIAALIFGRFIRKLSKRAQDELADSNVVVEETFQSVNIVKAFANELLEITRYRKTLDKVVNTSLKAAVYRGFFFSFIFVALFGGIIAVVVYGVTMIATGEITTGDLLMFALYTGFIGGSVAGLGDLYGQIQKTVGASERLREILDMESESELPESEAGMRSTRLEGELSFENVHFSYPTRTDVEVLQGLSLRVAPGEKIALVGHSGAGKSTIAQLILRFYKIQQGQIKVDGKDYTAYPLQAYRNNIGLVPQEVILFGGTIRENIAYGRPDASDEQIEAAAEQANALEFIQRFPEGLDTVVGERGIKLSGGQRQRIAIARAILKDPAILILDEATSSLDAESEQLVQSALDKLMEGRTTVIIAHRLSTIRKVDRIYVIDHGTIAESGPHEELSLKEGGTYNNLLALQMKG
jgi:ABC-type multidrug transport system fused ATPase/permease subunit